MKVSVYCPPPEYEIWPLIGNSVSPSEPFSGWNKKVSLIEGSRSPFPITLPYLSLAVKPAVHPIPAVPLEVQLFGSETTKLSYFGAPGLTLTEKGLPATRWPAVLAPTTSS